MNIIITPKSLAGIDNHKELHKWSESLYSAVVNNKLEGIPSEHLKLLGITPDSTMPVPGFPELPTHKISETYLVYYNKIQCGMFPVGDLRGSPADFEWTDFNEGHSLETIAMVVSSRLRACEDSSVKRPRSGGHYHKLMRYHMKCVIAAELLVDE